MLSAGVHGAIAHAHHSIHEAAAPKPVTVNFAGSFHASVGIPELGANLQFQGTFSKASVTLAVGKSYSTSFSQTLNLNEGGGLIIKSISGNLTGKVTGINNHVVTIAPKGSIKVAVSFNGTPVTISVVPKPGVNSTLTLDSLNEFVSLTGTFKLPTNAFLHGGDVNFTLTP